MKNPRVVRRSDYGHFDEECRKTERLLHGRMFFLSQSVAIVGGFVLFAVVMIGVVWLVQTALLVNDRYEEARITEHSQMAEKVFGK